MTPQTSLLQSLGFTHQSTGPDSQEHYTGHGLAFDLPPDLTDPVQIQAHILSAANHHFKVQARHLLTRIIGPIAKI